MTARILIADDSGAVRRSLHGLLEHNPDWKVCGEAVDGADVIAKAQQFKPDIIVIDFLMPRMTDIEAAGTLRRLLPCIPILIFTMDITDQLVEQAKSVGIKGAVQKSNTQEATLVGASLLWRMAMWMRSCAICKALMRKLRLSDSVRCQCGWEWQGHANGKTTATP